jgi:hypothetical protein
MADQFCDCASLPNAPPNQQPIIGRHLEILFKRQAGFLAQRL